MLFWSVVDLGDDVGTPIDLASVVIVVRAWSKENHDRFLAESRNLGILRWALMIASILVFFTAVAVLAVILCRPAGTEAEEAAVAARIPLLLWGHGIGVPLMGAVVWTTLEIRYYHNEITNIEMWLAALDGSLSIDDRETTLSILSRLAMVERNPPRLRGRKPAEVGAPGAFEQLLALANRKL